MVKIFVCSLLLISCIAAAPTESDHRGSFAEFSGNPIVVGEELVGPFARALEYGVPDVRNAVPHTEYGVPARSIELTTTTEHYCPEEDIVPPFADIPAGPAILPFPLPFPLPELKVEAPEVPIVPHSEYGLRDDVTTSTHVPFVELPLGPEILPLPLPEFSAVRFVPETTAIPEVPHAEYGIDVRVDAQEVSTFAPVQALPVIPWPRPPKPIARDILIVEEEVPIEYGPYEPKVEPTTTTTTTLAPYPEKLKTYAGRVESHYDTDSGLVREEFLKSAL